MKEEHLNEDQIIVSVVDEDDLPAGFKRHLKTCPLCQEERRVLMSRLDDMGATARDLAPRPKAGPLPDPDPGRRDSRLQYPIHRDPRPQDSRHRDPGHWRRVLFRWPVFASGLACFVIIAGIWGLMLFRGPQVKPQVPQVPQLNIAASGTPGQEQAAGMVSTEDLFEESVLPESYLDIAGASSEDLGGGPQEEPQVPQVNIAASESSGQEQVAGTASTEDLSEESALPESYLDIAGASAEDFGDGFLEFVAPLEEPGDSA